MNIDLFKALMSQMCTPCEMCGGCKIYCRNNKVHDEQEALWQAHRLQTKTEKTENANRTL